MGKRILTGIQSSGVPHLGNILGAIQPAIEMTQNKNDEFYFFVANMHSLTTVKDAEVLKYNTYATAATWLAFGLNTQKCVFYRQSDVQNVTELTWYLNCITPYPMLANAHSFKDKSDKLSDINTGLFNYPVLMAADILLYDIDIVPVGKDQKQHLEITRDIAKSFNRIYKNNVLVVPEPKINIDGMIVPGTDGQKMSKSYGNFIDIFLPEKKLRKQIMSITTDSTPMEEPKNTETCNIFNLYKLLATKTKITELKTKYEGGNFGYGHAKQELYELILNNFSEQREKYNYYMNNTKYIEEEFKRGKLKAQKVATATLSKIRQAIGV